MSETLKAPFPWFGGKSTVANIIWDRFGNVQNYVEPFFGSGAVLLGRPHEPSIETVNDLDGMVANFWRSVALKPEETAEAADWPVNENDLHARHSWLLGVKDGLRAKLEGDPNWCDPKIAGWWCWGICCWIGGGFCSGEGPWKVVDGQRVHLGSAGRGVNRQREIYEYFDLLRERLRNVRVCCGDWSRVCGPMPTVKQGLTAVFLDPPYSAESGRYECCYTVDDLSVAHAVREWAIQWGDDPKMRIAFCGYEGEHAMPDSWDCVAWKAQGGYGSQSDGAGRENSTRERIWFSPHCLKPQEELFKFQNANPKCEILDAKSHP